MGPNACKHVIFVLSTLFITTINLAAAVNNLETCLISLVDYGYLHTKSEAKSGEQSDATMPTHIPKESDYLRVLFFIIEPRRLKFGVRM